MKKPHPLAEPIEIYFRIQKVLDDSIAKPLDPSRKELRAALEELGDAIKDHLMKRPRAYALIRVKSAVKEGYFSETSHVPEALVSGSFSLITKIEEQRHQGHTPDHAAIAALLNIVYYEHEREAFLFASQLAAEMIEAGEALPEPLKKFATLVLMGMEAPKRQGRRKGHLFVRDLFLCDCMKVLTEDFGLPVRGGYQSRKLSACKVMADALHRCGAAMTEDALYKVYKSRAKFDEVRLTCHGIFPPPSIRVRPNLRTDNEANEIHGRADHRHPGRTRGRREVRGLVPQARHVGRDLL